MKKTGVAIGWFVVILGFSPVSMSKAADLLDKPFIEVMPSKCMAKPVGGNVYIDRIFPIGFSNDGHFAYLAWRETWGGNGLSLIIQDLIHDRITREVGYGMGDNFQDNESNLSIVNLITTHEDMISQVLKEYKISPLVDRELKKFPMLGNNDQINVFVRLESGEKGREANVKNPGWQHLIMKSEKKGEKEIAKNEHFVEIDRDLETIEGFLESPFEERIVVVTSGRKYIGEHDYSCGFSLFGAHLNVGFKK